MSGGSPVPDAWEEEEEEVGEWEEWAPLPAPRWEDFIGDFWGSIRVGGEDCV